MRQAILAILISLREVFGRPSYIFLSIGIFIAVLLFAIWLPNITFLTHTATSDTFTLSQKVGIITSTLGGLKTNFSFSSRTLTILVSLLFAINMSFLVFYLLRAAKLNRFAGLGISGFALGLIGIGCATCGSVILSAFFGIGATAGFIGFFPFKGGEFGIISITLLSLSIYLLSKKIKNPLVCNAKPVKPKSLFNRIPIWAKVSFFILIAFLIGILFTNWFLNGGGITKDALAAKFEKLSQNGNSSCSKDFKDSIATMPDNGRLQGSCCSPMNLHRYTEQVEGLTKYKNIKEIPPDPYDIEAGLAKKMLVHYDDKLTAKQQKEYDFAMTNSNEKGPCCCKCWRWYVYGGLGKFLIKNYNFTGQQITEVWNLSDGCGGEEDHVNHT